MDKTQAGLEKYQQQPVAINISIDSTDFNKTLREISTPFSSSEKRTILEILNKSKHLFPVLPCLLSCVKLRGLAINQKPTIFF